MTQPDSSSQVVSNVAAARTVIWREERRFLEPFVGRERATSKAAAELGVDVESMVYRVRRLVALGLLRHTRSEARKGRAIKYYRAAGRIVVPFTVMPYEDVEALFLEIDLPIRREAFRGLVQAAFETRFQDWKLYLYRREDQQVQVGFTPLGDDWTPQMLLAPEVPAVMMSWVPLAPEHEQAKALQRELFDLIARYHYPNQAPTHWLGLGLAPTPKP
mgnify:CR=1 FL=1